MISMNESNIYKLVPMYCTYFVLVITKDNAVYKKALWRVHNIKKRKSNETIILKRLRVV